MRKIKKAVALCYPEDADAPYISASAAGDGAKHLLESAAQNGIPIVQNSDLVDILSLQNVGSLIPEETYEIIAKIFVFVMKISGDEKK